MGLFTESVEKRTQLYFRDDRKFQFIKRPMEHSCLVEKADGKYKKAWKHFYNAEIPFAGYKGVSGDSVTLGFARDIILDPFNKIRVGDNPSEKPRIEGDGDSLRKWIAKIATNMRHIYSTKRERKTSADAVFWLIFGIDILMLIGWAVRYFTG